ncbi:protein FAM207A isoform X3 [Sus scrofa]|uniref:protein FAM207A isoform X3 n=1 Tax=Sus scrofa TaxID=9823 RepID=UPI000A2B728B|nr:protein FAM207A isoform X3 [Sus scrofa]
MGKVRGLRARVHQAAVRPAGEAAPGPAPPAREAAPPQAPAGGVGAKEWAVVGAGVFAGTTIDPSALVQRLDLDARSVASIRRGAEAKAVLPKKEKLKLRRERWLQTAGAAPAVGILSGSPCGRRYLSLGWTRGGSAGSQGRCVSPWISRSRTSLRCAGRLPRQQGAVVAAPRASRSPGSPAEREGGPGGWAALPLPRGPSGV